MLLQDVALLVLSGFLAYFLRAAISQHVAFLREPVAPREYLHLGLIFVPAWAWCSERFELHRVRVVTGRALELFRALVWTQAWGAVAISVLLVAAQVPLNRSLLVLFLASSTMLLLVGKVAQRVWARRRRGEALALVVGGPGGQEAHAVAEQSHLRGRQVEVVESADGPSLRERLRLGGVDEVVVAGTLPAERLMAVLEACNEAGVPAWVRMGGLTATPVPPRAEMLGTTVYLAYDRREADPLSILVKGVLDRTAAAVALVLLAPAFVVLAALVKMSSRGPVLFMQERGGLNGRPFRMLKFRTMRVGAEHERERLLAQNQMDGPVFKIDNDPRVTRVRPLPPPLEPGRAAPALQRPPRAHEPGRAAAPSRRGDPGAARSLPSASQRAAGAHVPLADPRPERPLFPGVDGPRPSIRRWLEPRARPRHPPAHRARPALRQGRSIVERAPAALKLPVTAGSAVERALRVACALGAAVVITSFHAVAQVYYGGLTVPQGYGMESLLPTEVMHYALLVVLGGIATALLAVALLGTSLPGAAVASLRILAARPWATAAACAVALSLACLLVSVEFLGDGILTDDEHVYRFIAQTLRTGSLTAPSPGKDLEFFREQFVVLTDKARYGKYPIGLPILLAAGQAVGFERAVVPLLTGLIALLVAWVGSREFPAPVVVLAVILFTLSPQVLLTGGATLLSQPLSAVCLMAALGCLLERDHGARGPAAWAAAAGALLAYGIVTRPLPTVLFAGVVIAALALGPRMGFRRGMTARDWAFFLAPLAMGPAAILWINFRQSGHPLHTGYHAIHSAGWGPTLVLYGSLATSTMSVVSHAVRLNFWLFGWPLSLAFCALARRTAFTLLCWGLVAAEVAYRLLSPKAGVGHAGALYAYEIVPILCLLTADGLYQLASRARLSPSLDVRRWLRTEVLASVLIALTLVNLSLFLPFKLADVSRAAYGQQQVFRDLRAKGVHHAAVFHRGIVPPWLGVTWAYFPPPNSPRLDDDVMFFVMPDGPDGVAKTLDFWQRRFPDRQAWVFGWDREKGPLLLPLTSSEGTAGGDPAVRPRS